MNTTHWGGPGEDYRLKKISSVNVDMVNGMSTPAPDDAAPVWQTPKARHSFPWLEVIITTVSTIGLIALVIFWLSPASSGVVSLVRTSLLALVPLLIVVSFILFIDRWEPEPWKTKGALFLWGAGVATISAGILNTALQENIILSLGDVNQSKALAATFIAPLIEETLKGLGVLIVVVVRRTNINSIIDGVVYAGFSACGFMFAEDILYFLRVDDPADSSLLFTFIMRGIASPFVHAMATSMTGIGLALALIKFKRGWSKTGIVLVFWFFAMVIHFVWNGTASFLGQYFFLIYLGIEVPAFVVWAITLIILSRKEAEKIRVGLVPYVRTGWLIPGEVTMATDRRARRAALKWARSGGREAKRAMRSFLVNLASLGMDQRLMAKHGPDRARIDNDQRMLAEAVENRREFLRLTSIAEQQQDVTDAVSRLAQAR